MIGTFKPGDESVIEKFKKQVEDSPQAAQGTNTYEALNIFFKDGGAFDDLPTVSFVFAPGVEVAISNHRRRLHSNYKRSCKWFLR